jgi:Mrp family chromosome partitioning ATPase
MSDGTVVVVRSGKTTRKALVHTVDELRKSKSPIIGIVFNEVKIRQGGYYSADHQRYLNGYYTS